MDLELVAIGTELLLGFTIDTNGAEIGRALGEIGVRVVRRTAVADGEADIRDAVGAALARTGAVITTGGLGPTRDDISKRVIAGLFDAPLAFDPSVWDDVLARYARFGRTPVESNRIQAEVPRGAVVLRNRWGTAPGLWLEGAAGLVVLLPGVPGEMRNLLRHEVVPRLVERGSGRVVRSRVVRTSGIPESTLAERLGEIEDDIAPLTLAYLPGVAGVDLRLSAWNLSPAEAEDRLTASAELLRARAGEHAYGQDDEDLAALVLELLRRRGAHLAVAESCTGGLLGGRLTDVPGSSATFVGGIIAYDNAVKREILGVPGAMLAAHGAVSEPVARAMAEGAARVFGVGAALSVTGVAGPGGGSEAKPVGTVWLGVTLDGETRALASMFGGDRREIRLRATQAALDLLRRRLTPTAGPGTAL